MPRIPAIIRSWPELEQQVAARLGMRCDDSLRTRLDEALAHRLKQLAISSSEDYMTRLAGNAGADEIEALAQHLTIGETYFFRGRDHFRALAETVLPELIRRNAGSRRLRLLSAGCSSGEEPYSLAILLQEQFPELASWQVDIVGGDLNAASLAKARRGLYTAWSLRDMPPEQLRRHFSTHGNQFELAADIRSRVRFETLNLMQDGAFWQQPPFDVVMCRNVLIYFTAAGISEVLQRIQRAISRDGYLFLGHSESLRGLSLAFHLCQSQDTFYYQLRDAEAAPLPPPDENFCADMPLAASAEPLSAFDEGAWMDSIRQSSERVERLSRPKAETRPRSAAPSTPPAPAAAAGSAALADEASALFRRERYDDAIRLIRQRLDESRAGIGDRAALLLLAAALSHQGRAAEAESVCRRLLVLDELDAEATYLLALCREQAGDNNGALRHAHTASYLDARFAMPRVLAGRIERQRGEPALARIQLGHAIRMLPQETERRWLLFGGGFSREALVQLCRSDLARCGGAAP